MDTQTLQEAIDKKAIAMAQKRMKFFTKTLADLIHGTGVEDYGWGQENTKKLVEAALVGMLQGRGEVKPIPAIIEFAQAEVTRELMESVDKINDLLTQERTE